MKIHALLASTALVLVTAAGAPFAADKDNYTKLAQANPDITQPAPNQRQVMPDAQMPDQQVGGMLASRIIGATVYGMDGSETIGEVGDVVIASDNSVESLIVDIGGFLGIGERQVALDYNAISWRTDDSGTPEIVIPMSREQLEALPVFDPEQTAALMPPAGADGGMAAVPATPAPRTDQPAVDRQAAMPAPDQDAGQMAAQPDRMAGQPSPDAGAADDQMAAQNPPAPAAEGMPISADQLIDATVYAGADDDDVGSVSDVLMRPDGTVDAVIIDVGGFLGIGAKPVAISFDDLSITRDENDSLVIRSPFTQEQLEAAPTYDLTAFETERDSAIVR